MAVLFLPESLSGQVLFTKQSPQEGRISRSTDRCDAELSYVTDAIPHPRPLAPEEKKE